MLLLSHPCSQKDCLIAKSDIACVVLRLAAWLPCDFHFRLRDYAWTSLAVFRCVNHISAATTD